MISLHATNNRVLKERRLISLIAKRRRVCNSISKPVGRMAHKDDGLAPRQQDLSLLMDEV